MRYLELGIFIIFFFLVCCKLTRINVLLGKIIFGIISLFSIVDILSIQTIDEHIGYSFFILCKRGIDNITSTIYTINFMIAISILILIVVIMYRGMVRSSRYIYKNINKCVILFVIFGSCSFLQSSVIKSLYDGINLSFRRYGDKNLEDILYTLGISDINFKVSKELTGTKGKNIVIIYVGGLEQNFLDNKLFPNLTPNLNKFIERTEWNLYKNYYCNGYKNMISGSMYTIQTGIPSYFGLAGDSALKNIIYSKAPTVGSVLDKAGYSLVYVGGKNSRVFESGGNFLEKIGYSLDKVNGRDYDIFQEGKNKYLELSKTGSFNLNIIASDINNPKLKKDERFKTLFGKYDNMEYNVAVLDYLIGDFINFIEKQPNGKDTVIFIIPDHFTPDKLLNEVERKKLKNKDRKLFLLTNTNIEGYEDRELNYHGYQVGDMILKGGEIDTNIKFLKDLVPNFDHRWINKNRVMLIELNYTLNNLVDKKKYGYSRRDSISSIRRKQELEADIDIMLATCLSGEQNK